MACGVAAAQRRQVLHDGVQRLLLDCRMEEENKKNHTEKSKMDVKRCLGIPEKQKEKTLLRDAAGHMGKAVGSSVKYLKYLMSSLN